jgi:probable HAF family extracellular repeat protein
MSTYNFTGGHGSTITVGNDNDTVNVNGGVNDKVTIGNGNDTLTVTGATGDTIVVGNGNDLITVSGGSGNTITVGSGNDTVKAAGESNDTVTLGSGTDVLYLGVSDTVNVGTGNALLVVPATNPVLVAPPSISVLEDHKVGLGLSASLSALGFGQEKISGFSSVDRIQFDTSQFANFAAVMAAATQVGQNTVIKASASDTITLMNVRLSTLKSTNFVFTSGGGSGASVSLTISGVSSDATLSSAADPSGVIYNSSTNVWTVAAAALSDLTLKAGHVTTASLNVTATDSATGYSITRTIALTVNPVAPALSAPAALSVSEDGMVALGISETPFDPRDTVTLTISGVPADASLSAGNKNSDGSWTLTPAQLAGLTLTAGEVTATTLRVTATNTQGVSASTSRTIALTVNPVAPALSAPAALSVSEDGMVALGISETPFDPRDTVSITITGVPAGASLSDNAGALTPNPDGSYTLTPAQLAGLTMAAGEVIAPTYSYQTLDYPGAIATAASGINDSGQVVGTYGIANEYGGFGFLYNTSNGSYTTFTSSVAGTLQNIGGINDSGDIVGVSNVLGNFGFVYDKSANNYAVLPTYLQNFGAGGFDHLAINNDGVILVQADFYNVLYSNGQYTDLDNVLPALDSRLPSYPAVSYKPLGINDAGEIVGVLSNGQGGQGFVYSGGVLQVIDDPLDQGFVRLNAAHETAALGVNDEGDVVGTYSTGTTSYGFLYSAGKWTTIAPPGAVSATAYGINDAGQIVGSYTDVNGATHAFIATLQPTLTVTATNTQGVTASTSRTVALTVNPVAPTLTLSSNALSVNEDGMVLLGISETPFDRRDTVALTITGVPADASLSAGNKNGDGSWSLTPSQLTGLMLIAGEATNATLTITATNTQGATASTSRTMALTVNPVAMVPSLSVSAGSGAEGSAIPLSISAAQVEADLAAGNLTITISGLQGDTLNSGTLNGDGSYTLTASNLSGLTFTPTSEFTGTIDLSVTATDTEPSSGTTASSTAQTLAVVVNPIAEAPSLSVTAASGAEGSAIPLSISAAQVEADLAAGNMAITISGLQGGTLNHGTLNTDGSYTLTASDPSGLAFTPTTEFTGTINLSVTATDTEPSSGTSASTPQTLVVMVNPTAEAPSLSVSAATGAEGSAIPLSISAAQVEADLAAGNLTITISGLQGTLNNGSFNGDGSYTLTASELSGLTFTPTSELTGTINLSVTATDTESSSGTSASTPQTLVVVVNPTAEAPSLSVSPATGAEGSAIPLSISAAQVEADLAAGNLAITISGLQGGTLNNGTLNGDGSYTLTASDLSGLTFTPTSEFTGTINLSVIATDTEQSSATTASSTAQTLVVTVIPNSVARAPILTVPAPQVILGALTLVSSTAAGVAANGNSFHPNISPDGTEVVFYSLGTTNLVPNVSNEEVYLKNLATGAVTLVSANVSGTPANSSNGGYPDNSSQVIMFSPDSQEIAFELSSTNLVPTGTNGDDQIFVKNLTTGAVTLVSGNASGVEGNGNSIDFTFSPDGLSVAFDSAATNLFPNQTNANEIFVKNLATGAITLVSTNASGVEANNISEWPVFSPDGNELAFVSYATNLTTSATSGVGEVFVKNLTTGTIQLVSAAPDGTAANNSSWLAQFSPDGTEVVFSSYATNLIPGVIGEQIYLKNLTTGAITLVSAHASGVPADGGVSQVAGFSPDGTKVVFYSDATNLVSGSSGLQTYMKDLTSGTVTLVSTNGSGGNSYYSPAGNAIAYDTLNGGTSQILLRSVTPGAIADENTPLTISGITASLAPGQGNDTLSLTLSVGHGSLALGSTAGLTITSGGTDGTLSFSGSQADISGALASGVIYAPAAGFAGGDTLTVTATDTAQNSSTASTTKTLALTVNAGSFTFTRLDDPVGVNGETMASGINSAGQIVGSYDGQHGFLFANGNYTTVDDPSSTVTGARGINSAGQIVGSYGGSYSDGFVDDNGTFVTLDVPQALATHPVDINSAGQIVGNYSIHYSSGTTTNAFLYSAGTFITLSGPQGATGDGAEGINSAGQIVGFYTAGSPIPHGFVFSNGGYTTIDDPLGINGTIAEGINDAGQIVGYYYDGSNNTHGFLYSGGNFVTIDDPAGNNTKPLDINNAGQIVGFYLDSSGEHGFIAVDPPNATVVITDGNKVELNTDASPDVKFGGSVGTLRLDQSASFTGQISCFSAQDRIDLGDIGFGASTTIGFVPNASGTGGTLTVGDGTHTASLALLGQYMASTFVTSADGHGGTLITETPPNASTLVAAAHPQ